MYDLIVLGGGPGGYRAAELAGKFGIKTALIEKDYLGGMCLNRGCIPTKAYYSDVIGKIGNVKNMWDKKEAVVQTLREGIAQLMEMHSVDVIFGTGTIKDTSDVKKIEVETKEGKKVIEGKNIIIAVGSKSMDIKFENNNLQEVIKGDIGVTREDLWKTDEVKSVVVMGAGVIAVEFAVMLKEMGKEVTMLKHSKEVLRKSDKDIKKRLISTLKKRKIKMIDSFEIAKVEKKENSIVVYGSSPKGEKEIECDRLVLASSMVPILEGYGLENSNIEYDKKGIKVDKYMKTNLDGVYAIGDVTGGMMLAHVAEYEAMAAVYAISGKDYTIDYNSVPYCVFSDPEIASVGLTEQQAEEKGLKIKIGKSNFMSNGMALAMGKAEGFVKVIADENNKILGVHIMGPEAATMIGEAALAIYAGMTADQVAKCVHAHPTLSECLKDALFSLVG
ncbi:dihydrolipoyl dehydrogenase [Clostridium acetireducens DSM 10703]|jgi:dihydrolipoamide dehydrogenase|uniref:Dihydrolipoyl dehydrogenase n=1 Tax=Clostridium acetireducens DSM 10703 TaxID=1121290 RepID=A0A1E8EYY2_9CLOT|nr:FAD-dependent oxidoreductase [Clostridium acetireducens]OFI05907.1 dihydrolipoyl dehydrogenase [Clostridium acetireducens DSM 10703]